MGANACKLTPEYDVHGKPKHPYLGELFIILIPTPELDRLNPNFVLNLYASRKIKVNCRIIHEREVTFHGAIPGQYIKLALPIRVPSFQRDWQFWHEAKYGLSKNAFNKYKQKLLVTHGDIDQQIEIMQKLEDKIAKFRHERLIHNLQSLLNSKNSQLLWKSLNGFTPTALCIEEVIKARKNLQ